MVFCFCYYICKCLYITKSGAILIALERFLNFEQIIDNVGTDTYANAAANSTHQMAQSDNNPKLAYSIINAYSVDYHIGNKLLVILGLDSV